MVDNNTQFFCAWTNAVESYALPDHSTGLRVRELTQADYESGTSCSINRIWRVHSHARHLTGGCDWRFGVAFQDSNGRWYELTNWQEILSAREHVMQEQRTPETGMGNLRWQDIVAPNIVAVN